MTCDQDYVEDVQLVGSLAEWDTIQRVILRLPEDVGRWASENIVFISATGAHAAAESIPCRRSEARYTEEPSNHGGVVLIVILGDSEDSADEEVEFTIAHEIAHHWCGHKRTFEATEYERQEQEADATANAWEFPGRSTRII